MSGLQHLLVVDDEPAICDVLQLFLEGHGGCRVTSASSGELAATILDCDPPDLAIIDVVLPRLSGLQVAKHAVDLDIPILLMTGNPETSERLNETGCAFLNKPFRLAALLSAVEAILRNPSAHRAYARAALKRFSAARPPRKTQPTHA